MKRLLYVFFFQFMLLPLTAQDIPLPNDFRQHNLTQFNSSLLNPVFSLDRNNPHSVSLWSRWQWQTIDGDPTTVFLSYTGSFGEKSAFSVSFLQNNTGTFLNTGGVLNYAHRFDFDDNIKLAVGLNILGFQQELADNRFLNDNELDLPQLDNSNEFLFSFNPGISLSINKFSVGLAIEDALNFSLTEGVRDAERNFVGMLSNDFPIFLFEGVDNAFIRPIAYVKTISNADAQYGLNALLSTSKFWVQGGYNNFYGPSAGAGITFLKNLSVGGLFEFPVDSDLSEETSTFEVLLSYHFGRTDKRKKVVGFDVVQEPEVAIDSKEPEVAIESIDPEVIVGSEASEVTGDSEAPQVAVETDKPDDIIEQKKLTNKPIKKRKERRRDRLARLQREKDSLQRMRNEAIQDSLNQVKLAAEQKRKQDSILQAKEAALLAEQKRQDSITALQQQEVTLLPNEKYQEVTNADGLEPGFYLIANVFGTKRYYESFMANMRAKGLNPKSFYRKVNRYNYVYLGKYNTMDEARRARDSKLNGKYPDKTWIFRVRRK